MLELDHDLAGPCPLHEHPSLRRNVNDMKSVTLFGRMLMYVHTYVVLLLVFIAAYAVCDHGRKCSRGVIQTTRQNDMRTSSGN